MLLVSQYIEVDSFKAAKEYLGLGAESTPSISMLFATVDNHICYQQMGNNPIRQDYHAAGYVKDGSTSKYDWLGIMPAADRVHICDPPKGFLVVSNNQVANEKVHGGYFKYSIFTARADRLTELIN